MTDWAEFLAQLTVPLYSPRPHPLPIPAVGAFDEPTACLKINRDWAAHLRGAIEVLDQPDAWEGTDTEVYAARQEVLSILVALAEGVCMDCNDVTGCLPEIEAALISSGKVVQNTVNVTSNTTINERFPPEERQQPILPDPPGCDQDAIWGACYEIAQRIDQKGLDFWQQVVANTDPIDRIADIIALVPVVGDIAGEIIALFAQESDNLRAGYEAYSTPAAIETIACDLFQIVCSQCRYPTYQEVSDYYAAAGVTDVHDWANIGLEAMVDYLIGTSNLADRVIYFTTNIFQLWVREAGEWFMGQRGKDFIDHWATLGKNNGDSDWQILCGDCTDVLATWEYTFDFTAAQHNWSTFFSQSGWTAGVGWHDADNAYVHIKRQTLRQNGTITSAELHVRRPSPDTSAVAQIYTAKNHAGDWDKQVKWERIGATAETEVIKAWDINGSIDTYIHLYIDNGGLRPVELSKLVLRGFGGDPFTF